ncbi:Copine_I [Hexamita inflata]|uniref:Copine I n=1 Tax=Hexamita inflata TaxID=28002 RepID=A0AA86P004_9EUKA|nr:Copine I [Hexamita inflata]
MGLCQSKPLSLAFATKYTSIEQIRGRSQSYSNINFQCVISIDFSASNGMLHSNTSSPYLQIIYEIEPVVLYLTQSDILSFRFGCADSTDKSIVPLINEQFRFHSFQELIDGYKTAVDNVIQSGPTRFKATVEKCIRIIVEQNEDQNNKEKQTESKQQFVTLCFIPTDGQLNTEDAEILVEASKYAICFIVIGLGSEDFSGYKEFNPTGRKFNNFAFIDYENIRNAAEHIDVSQKLSLMIFDHIEAQIQDMTKAGII